MKDVPKLDFQDCLILWWNRSWPIVLWDCIIAACDSQGENEMKYLEQ